MVSENKGCNDPDNHAERIIGPSSQDRFQMAGA